MASLSYLKTVQELESRGIMPESAPSLKPMKAALERMRDTLRFDPEKTIVVAGTNGKGSVCASLEALLQSAGQKVGLYTSPHLEDTRERIRINRQEISEEDFCKAYEQVSQLTQGLRLTHFEMLTLMAAWVFYGPENKVEWRIFEVGLGGLWDATNAIPHRHCVITALGLDHQNLLGQTLPEIARNKFGIVTRSARVVHAPLPLSVQGLADEVCRQTSSEWTPMGSFKIQVKEGPVFVVKTPWGEAALSLPGRRSAENAMIALGAFENLGFNPQLHLNALSQVNWPGRMEKVVCSQVKAPVFLSGDHNVQGIQSLLELLPYYRRNKLFILCGIAKDKNRDEMLKLLFSLGGEQNSQKNTEIFLTTTPFRGAPVNDYGHWLTRASGHSDDSEALFREITRKAEKQDMILVTGSLYLVGKIRGLLRTAYATL